MAKAKKNPVETDEAVVTEMHNDKDLASGVKDGAAATNKKSVAMHAVLSKMSGMDSDEVAFFNKSMSQDYAPSISDGAAAQHKSSVAMHKTVKEDLESVFGDNEALTEEFKESITTLFEAAVGSRVILEMAELEEKYEAQLNEEIEVVTESLIDKMDDYLGYVAQEWIVENEVAIESTLRTELAESFIHDLKDLFVEHQIEVPEERVDVFEMLARKVDELEAGMNEIMGENKSLKENNSVYEKDILIDSKTEGLTLMQSDKFRQLSEGVEYNGDVEEFEGKLDIIKEHHFSKKGKAKTEIITEEISHDPNEKIDDGSGPTNPDMQKYVNFMHKTNRADVEV